MTKKLRGPYRTRFVSDFPKLVAQWHPTLNGTLTPADVSAGSGKRITWRCKKGPDHVWPATADKRTSGQGCPFCAGRQASVTNSLQARFPGLALQWHPTRNGSLTPSQVVAGSSKKVWWFCPHGPDHVYDASLDKRTRGRGCPFCAGKRVSVTNGLVHLYPQVAAEWDVQRNGASRPDDFTYASNKKKWWTCDVAPDHVWDATIANRTLNDSRCPFCAGQKVCNSNCLATTYPAVAAEWHPTRNRAITPRDILGTSNRKVWWQCPKADDHQWPAVVQTRTRAGYGCPFCTGRRADSETNLAVLNPSLAKQWHPTRNGHLTPRDLGPGSHAHVWWQCPKNPSHKWFASVKNRSKGDGCPHCAPWGKGEEICRAFFEQLFGKPFPKVRPAWLEGSKGRSLELDGYCGELALAFEHQGEHHYRIVPVFTPTAADLKAVQANDALKRRLCEEHGVALIAIPAVPTLTRVAKLKGVIDRRCRALGVPLGAMFHATNPDVRELLAEGLRRRAGATGQDWTSRR